MPRSSRTITALVHTVKPHIAPPAAARGCAKPRSVRSGVWGAIRTLMPGRAVLPDSAVFAGVSMGPIAPIPAAIVPHLRAKCPLAHDGRTAAETHRLVYVPAALNGEPTSVAVLRAFGMERGGRALPLFASLAGLHREHFETAPLPNGIWVLGYGEIEPPAGWGCIKPGIAGGYRTARAIEQVALLILCVLEHGERLLPHSYARTADVFASGEEVCVGNLHGARPIVRAQETAAIPRGRALVWSHDCALPFNDKG